MGTYSDYLQLRSGVAPPPSPHDLDVRVYADADAVLHELQADGTDTVIGSGGSDPATLPRGVYDNAPSQIVPSGGGNTPLPIGYDYGDEVLDITDPANPLVITAGIYSVWVEVYGDGAETSVLSASLNLGVDDNNDFGYAPIEGTCSAQQSLGMGLTYYCRQGSAITITVGQNAGGDRTYHALLVIQRVA